MPRWVLPNLLPALAIVAALVVLLVRSEGSPGIVVEFREPLPGIDEIRVDVGGAVLRPGVVAVTPGERVIDAIERAGGVSEDADTAPLNLSRRPVDQDRIRVPRVGEADALLDINAASAAELEALPGIGPVYAAAVLAARADAPFATTDELLGREVIPAHVYERMRDLIRVR